MSKATNLRLVWTNPERPAYASVRRPRLALVLNDNYSQSAISRAQELAASLAREFERLSCNSSWTTRVSIRIDEKTPDKDRETALAILRGQGFRTEYVVEPAYLPFMAPTAKVSLEKR